MVPVSWLNSNFASIWCSMFVLASLWYPLIITWNFIVCTVSSDKINLRLDMIFWNKKKLIPSLFDYSFCSHFIGIWIVSLKKLRNWCCHLTNEIFQQLQLSCWRTLVWLTLFPCFPLVPFGPSAPGGPVSPNSPFSPGTPVCHAYKIKQPTLVLQVQPYLLQRQINKNYKKLQTNNKQFNKRTKKMCKNLFEHKWHHPHLFLSIRVVLLVYQLDLIWVLKSTYRVVQGVLEDLRTFPLELVLLILMSLNLFLPFLLCHPRKISTFLSINISME